MVGGMNFSLKRNKVKVLLVFSIMVNVIILHKLYEAHVEDIHKHSVNSTNKTTEKALTTKESTDGINNVQQELLSRLEDCGHPQSLVGDLKIDFKEMNSSFFQLKKNYEKNNESKVVFEPHHCIAKSTVAIIIPYRDREEHLRLLLGHLHPILQRHLTRYQIFVVEQAGNTTFNKGRVMNTGFQFVKENFGIPFDCFIFHDVDMFPENDKNIYECSATDVRHLSCSLNKFNYHPLCCGMTVGGVLAFTGDQYMKVNGFPNNYWGWGGEDDDMNTRIKLNHLKIQRPAFKTCRYFMIEHQRDALNPYIPDSVNSRTSNAKHFASNNGLNSLNSSVLKYEKLPLYVHLLVDVGVPDKLA